MLAMTEVALFVLIGGSGYKDMCERRIPNYITLSCIILGWGLGLLTNGITGFFHSFLGTLVGLSIFLIPFVLGGMGAGDVKLLAAIGSLMGWRFAFNAAVFSALVGGIMVFFYLWKHRQLKETFYNLLFPVLTVLTKILWKFRFSDYLVILQHRLAKKLTGYQKIYIPYGVAIALGSVIVWALESNLLP